MEDQEMEAATVKSRSLWSITDELSEIGAMIADAGGEITPEIEARLDAMEGSFEDKVQNVALRIRSVEVNAEGAKAEKDRLAKLQKYWEGEVAGLKKYLLGCMLRAEKLRVEGERARVRVQKSGTPSIQYRGDLLDLPKQFVRVVPETMALDAKALTEAVRAKEEIPEGVVVSYSQSVVIF